MAVKGAAGFFQRWPMVGTRGAGMSSLTDIVALDAEEKRKKERSKRAKQDPHSKGQSHDCDANAAALSASG